MGIVLSVFTLQPLFAQAPIRGINEYSPRELVHYFAEKYNVSEAQMSKTISCESGWDTLNHYKTSREDSWGLVQINLYAHPEVTKEQATDAMFATEFMAKNFSLGHQKMWTCWTKNFT